MEDSKSGGFVTIGKNFRVFAVQTEVFLAKFDFNLGNFTSVLFFNVRVQKVTNFNVGSRFEAIVGVDQMVVSQSESSRAGGGDLDTVVEDDVRNDTDWGFGGLKLSEGDFSSLVGDEGILVEAFGTTGVLGGLTISVNAVVETINSDTTGWVSSSSGTVGGIVLEGSTTVGQVRAGGINWDAGVIEGCRQQEDWALALGFIVCGQRDIESSIHQCISTTFGLTEVGKTFEAEGCASDSGTGAAFIEAGRDLDELSSTVAVFPAGDDGVVAQSGSEKEERQQGLHDELNIQ